MTTKLHIAAIALGLALAGAAAAQPQPTPIWIVKIGGAQAETISVSDGAGGFAGAVPADQPAPERVLTDVALRQPDPLLSEVETPATGTFTVEWRSDRQPIQVDAYEQLGNTVLAVHRFGPEETVLDRRVRLVLADAAAPVLTRDADGDGTPEQAVAERVALTGPAAADKTPPVLTYERLADGHHQLTLRDGADDLSDAEHLSFSFDGHRFQPYTGPIALDPRATPVLFAFGEDRAGNTTSVMRFDARPPFCERVQHDRSELADAVGDALESAVAAGELSTPNGVAVLAHGRAACLWRTGLLGGDVSCDACTGVFQPGLDALSLEVFVPDAAGEAARAALAGRIAEQGGQSARGLGALTVGVHARSALDTGHLPPGGPDGADALAPQLALLAWSAEGAYVDLGAARPDVSGPSLGALAASLGAGGAVPALEGHEAARAGERTLLETGIGIRVMGATAGANPADPAGEPYFASLHRRQLEAAADASLAAAAGLLGADACAVQSDLLALSPGQVAAARCGAAPCPGFEAAAAQRAAADASTCPTLFSDTERALVAKMARVAARDPAELAPLFADECVANQHLADALGLVRALAGRTRAAYDAGLASVPAPERSAREANLAHAADAVAQRLAHPTLDLRFQLTNTSTQALTDVPVRLFDDRVSTGQEQRLTIASGARRIVEGSALRTEPFFLRVDAAAVATNVRRDAVYVVDPDGTRPNPDGKRIFTGFTYFLFDPGNVICPGPGHIYDPLQPRRSAP